MIDAAELRKIEVFADLSDGDLAWLADHADLIELDVGEALFEEGDPAEQLLAILDGEVRLRRENGPPDDRWIVRSAGKISGALPLSRLTHAPVTARAIAPTRALSWPNAVVTEMLDKVPVLNGRLASVMLDRSREFTRLDEQRQRMMSLGKLSAGLAHELNNPAAAIQRHVDDVARRVADLSDLVAAELGRRVPPERLATLRRAASSVTAEDAVALDPLARSDAQDAVRGWLEDHGVPDAWSAAETLVDAGVSAAALDAASEGAPSDVAAQIARWTEADVAAQRLLSDVGEAARRILDLIGSVKAYSHMDRASAKEPLDVNAGLRSTGTMLEHKVRNAGLTLRMELDPDLPNVIANAGELNQVWTNLIDNAIDASPRGGTIVVRSLVEADGVRVRVVDEGTGIPAEVQQRIFEPFFTTKGVGEGTGVGLDVVRRIVRGHGGSVHVASEPGRTCFDVDLPVASGVDSGGRDGS